MSEYIEDGENEDHEPDYFMEIENLKTDLWNGEQLPEESAQKLVEYMERVEGLLSELANKTGFSEDYCGGWRGYLAEEYGL